MLGFLNRYIPSRRTVFPPTIMASLLPRNSNTLCLESLLLTHDASPLLAAIFPDRIEVRYTNKESFWNPVHISNSEARNILEALEFRGSMFNGMHKQCLLVAKRNGIH